MKRFLLFPCALCLVIGLLVGILLPVDWTGENTPPTVSNNPGVLTPPSDQTGGLPADQTGAPPAEPAEPKALDTADNFPLLSTACAVNRLLQQKDYAALSAYVHADRGVTFTPYSSVDSERDLCFTPAQIKNLPQDQTVYTWGIEDGRGDPIQMTMEEYFARFVYDKDYTQAPQIAIDRIITGGNALENLTEVYTDCRFVDFTHPSADPVMDGLDWSSLKLVFAPNGERWCLVAVVHGEWTI